MDKIAKIKAELEKRIEDDTLSNYMRSYYNGLLFSISDLEEFAETLPEEPVSKVWHDASETPEYDRKVVFADKNFLGKYVGGTWENNSKWAYLSDLLKVDTVKQEEPVSEDLKKIVDSAFDNFFKGHKEFDKTYIGGGAKAAAIECSISAAQWQKERLISKACEWLEEHDTRNYEVFDDFSRTYVVDNQKMIDDFRKTLEEGRL